MDIHRFREIITSFADEPSNVDVGSGRIVAQVRDEVLEADLSFDQDGNIAVVENGQRYSARTWIVNRIAKLPQLADRIIATTNEDPTFVFPSGLITPDLSASIMNDGIKDEYTDDIIEVLTRSVNTPVPGATSVLYITSDAGEGKTTVINRLAHIQAQKFRKKEVNNLLVPIPLGGKTFLTFDDAVIATLVNKLRFNYLYFDAFINLIKLGAIVPAFDGYEEMLVEGSKNEAVSALGNMVNNLDSQGTIFIAARKAFFDYVSFKTQAKLLDAIGDTSAVFSRVEISRWNKAKFLEYGKSRNVEDLESIYGTVCERLGPDHPMLTRAVLVKRLFDVIANLKETRELADSLGTNPDDYFFRFVNTIIEREASEKWISRTSNDVMQPILEIKEHHELLSLIAQEMWQTSVTSLRYDVIEVIVEIFCEQKGKPANVTRQIKERIKQHSLLISDASKGQALAFDHEDFFNFYIGESLGRILYSKSKSDAQALMSINVLTKAAVEQSVKYLMRMRANIFEVIEFLMEINTNEYGFTYCKENCGALIIRASECYSSTDSHPTYTNMFFMSESLSGRNLSNITFVSCHFQSTSVSGSYLKNIQFEDCEFDSIDLSKDSSAISGCGFNNCRISSLYLDDDDETIFNPDKINLLLKKYGASVFELNNIVANDVHNNDEYIKILEKFLRIFLNRTRVDEDIIKVKLGSSGATTFLDIMLPQLIKISVLEEITWKGSGVKRMFKLAVPMSQLNRCLENSNGSFDLFLKEITPDSVS